MSFGDEGDDVESFFAHEREPGRNEPDDEQLGAYPDPPTPDAVRAYATRRADIASERALRTGALVDAQIADFWIKQIEPAVKDAVLLQRMKARLSAQETGS
jgi:hypothetical protein